MEKVLELVKKIPKGMITTYRELAKASGSHPRKVAKILSKNLNNKIPCHRVVYANGCIAGYNRGVRKKISLLRKEGVKINGNKILNFQEILYRFKGRGGTRTRE